MTKAKRMLAILMTLTMVLSMTFAMSLTSYAADPAYDGKLTVTGLTDGDVANFYKVVEWVGSEEGNVGGWKAVAPYDVDLNEEVLTAVLIGDPSATPPVAPTGITSELAGKIARRAVTDHVSVTASGGKAEYAVPEGGEGLYLVLITPKDADTVYNPVFVAADYNKSNSSASWAITEDKTYADEAAAKKNTIPLTKKASAVEESYQDGNWQSTRIGETVSFTVETKIPGYGKVYNNPVFKVTDKLTDLTLETDTVTVVEPEGLVKGTDYTVTAAASGYTVEFAAAYLKTLSVPTDVKISYDAVVATEAPLHVNQEKNEVSTEFSNNPGSEGSHGFKKDVTNHYTFTLDAEGLGCTTQEHGEKTSEIVKVGVDAAGNPINQTTENSEITETEEWEGPLEGAKFKLYTDAAATKEYKDAEGNALNIVTGADGRMTITGLDAGTYYLKEDEAPAGFIKDNTTHKIEIIATTQDVEVTEYADKDTGEWISEEEYNALPANDKQYYQSYKYTTDVLKKYEVKIDGVATATYNFTNKGSDAEIIWTETPPVEKPCQIVNTKGTELPSTGGIGTIIFYTIGTILVIVCGIVLISRRRIQKNK